MYSVHTLFGLLIFVFLYLIFKFVNIVQFFMIDLEDVIEK